MKSQKLATLLTAIKENVMTPFYEHVCADWNIDVDDSQLAEMKAANQKKISEIDAEIEDAEKNLGESEVRQALLTKFEYYCQIGDKENAEKTYTATYEKTVGIGYRIDLVFAMIRVGLFFLDHHLINTYITKAKELMDQGEDWERKNRLRSYEALYRMSVRDFAGASNVFLEVVPAFGSYELMTYENLIMYTVITTTFALKRPDLRSKVMRCIEVQEQLTGGGANGSLIPRNEGQIQPDVKKEVEECEEFDHWRGTGHSIGQQKLLALEDNEAETAEALKELEEDGEKEKAKNNGKGDENAAVGGSCDGRGADGGGEKKDGILPPSGSSRTSGRTRTSGTSDRDNRHRSNSRSKKARGSTVPVPSQRRRSTQKKIHKKLCFVNTILLSDKEYQLAVEEGLVPQ